MEQERTDRCASTGFVPVPAATSRKHFARTAHHGHRLALRIAPRTVFTTTSCAASHRARTSAPGQRGIRNGIAAQIVVQRSCIAKRHDQPAPRRVRSRARGERPGHHGKPLDRIGNHRARRWMSEKGSCDRRPQSSEHIVARFEMIVEGREQPRPLRMTSSTVLYRSRRWSRGGREDATTLVSARVISASN